MKVLKCKRINFSTRITFYTRDRREKWFELFDGQKVEIIKKGGNQWGFPYSVLCDPNDMWF